MAVSVSSFSQVADWFDAISATHTVTGVAWDSGDVIVVMGGVEDNSQTLGNPTNANLTFGAPNASSTAGGAGQCGFYVWATTAGSSQTGQTISITRSGGGKEHGIGVWVCTGASGSVANASANQTESAFTFTPTAGSAVIYGFIDWSANTTDQTQTTGTGTATERRDAGNGATYGQYLADWAGVTASSTSFGVTSYTSLQVSHGVIEILASAAPAAVPPILVMGPRTY